MTSRSVRHFAGHGHVVCMCYTGTVAHTYPLQLPRLVTEGLATRLAEQFLKKSTIEYVSMYPGQTGLHTHLREYELLQE